MLIVKKLHVIAKIAIFELITTQNNIQHLKSTKKSEKSKIHQ